LVEKALPKCSEPYLAYQRQVAGISQSRRRLRKRHAFAKGQVHSPSGRESREIFGKRSGLWRLSLLLAEVAKMPGPDEALGKNDERACHDGHTNERSAMAKMISSTKQEYEYDIPEPAQGDERLDHESPQF
jgi:hypothetical protein